MKRLLAAGSGSIYQIAKAFRNAEIGRHHCPEFTMLEWYRVGWSLHQLMDEVQELVLPMLGEDLEASAPERLTYGELFAQFTGLNPHTCKLSELIEAAGEDRPATLDDRDGLLAFLLVQRIEPELASKRLVFVHDFPASQAALAQLRVDDRGVEVAERFEVYCQGIELGNGFHELADAIEQRRRFVRDGARREALGLPPIEPDARLLAALGAGLPDCSGVAIGLDRLLMIAVGAHSLDQVIAFPIDRA